MRNAGPASLLRRVLPSSPATAFLLVAAVACVTNLLVIAAAPWTGISEGFGGLTHDGYLQLARSLLAGHGFVFEAGEPPVFHRPPLYPVLLLPIVALPEMLQRPVLVVVQSALLGGAAALAWQIGTRLFGQAVGRVAVGVMLVHPWLFWVVKNPHHIVLQTFLYTSFCWLLLQAFAPAGPASRREGQRSSPPSPRRLALLLGLNGGALALVHGTMLLTCGLVLAGVCLWRLRIGDVRSAASAVVAIVLMAAVVAPWTARNWLTFGAFIPVVGNAGLTYFLGNQHWGIGHPVRREGESPWGAALRHAGLDPGHAEAIRFWGVLDRDLEAAFTRRMVEHMRSRPDELLVKVALNAGEYYFPVLHLVYMQVGADDAPRESTARSYPRSTAITLLHATLWTLSIAAVVRRRRSPREVRAWCAVVGLVTVFPLAYFPFLVWVGHSLYALPTIPLLAVLSGAGLVPVRRREPAALVAGVHAAR